MSSKKNQNTKILSGILIGSAIGLTCSLIDPATRRKTIQNVKYMRDYSSRFIQNYKEHPDESKQEWKDKVNNTSESMKELMEDSQHLYKQIQSTVRERSKDIQEIAQDFKQLYFQTKRQYKKVAHTLKDTKKQMIGSVDNSDTNTLPMTMEKRDLIKVEQQTL
ncbi:MAG TPA: YtxH domain-containing protein [Niallia sp.]|nr:YtxH domain-containing protein [Niallia sp.]